MGTAETFKITNCDLKEGRGTPETFKMTNCDLEQARGTPQPFKVTNCDLKESSRNTPQIPALRVHRAWNLNALKRAKVAASRAGEHSDHADVRQVARDVHLE